MPHYASIIMKLQPDRILGQTITGHGKGWVAIDGEKFHQSIMIAWNGYRATCQDGIENSLDSTEFADLLQIRPEILLVGGGSQKSAISPIKLALLTVQNMGVETMDTAAACRTYNVLAAENRKVAAILLIDRLDT